MDHYFLFELIFLVLKSVYRKSKNWIESNCGLDWCTHTHVLTGKKFCAVTYICSVYFFYFVFPIYVLCICMAPGFFFFESMEVNVILLLLLLYSEREKICLWYTHTEESIYLIGRIFSLQLSPYTKVVFFFFINRKNFLV